MIPAHIPPLNEAQQESFVHSRLKKPTLEAVSAQSRIVLAMKACKEWVKNRPDVDPVKGCTSVVLPLYANDLDNEPALYFKEGPLSARIERFIWDLAVILKWEDLFRATTVGKIQGIKVSRFHDSSSEDVSAEKYMHGGFKEAVKGVLFKKYKGDVPIQAASLRRAFVAMYLFGLSDIHANNAIIDPEGKIVLIDCTRCLPHSNTYQLSAQGVRPVHRFVFFNLHASSEPLDEMAMNEMRDMVKSVKESLPELKQFFLSTWAEIKLLHVPQNWIDLKLAYKCFEERVATLEKALTTSQSTSLLDLMAVCYPEYPFVFFVSALHHCLKKNWPLTEEVCSTIHETVGWKSIIDLCADLTCEMHYDLPKIYHKAHEPGTTVNSLIQWVRNNPEKLKIKVYSDVDLVAHFLDLRTWIKMTFLNIPEDNKEISQSINPIDYSQMLGEYAMGFLTSNGFGPFKIGTKAEFQALTRRPRRSYIYQLEETKEMYAVYRSRSPAFLYKSTS